MSYNNQQQREPANYLRASSVTKTIHNNQKQGEKHREDFSFDTTEEISFTLTHEKAVDLINRLQAAMNDESGTGGVRISMYGKRSENKHTREVFDGLGILVYAQKPPREGNFGGSFQGRSGNSWNKGGGGRRQYPPKQTSQRGSYGAPDGNGGSRTTTTNNYHGASKDGGGYRGKQHAPSTGSQNQTTKAGAREGSQQTTNNKQEYQEQPEF